MNPLIVLLCGNIPYMVMLVLLEIYIGVDVTTLKQDVNRIRTFVRLCYIHTPAGHNVMTEICETFKKSQSLRYLL